MILLSVLPDVTLAQSDSLYRWYPSKSRFPEGECVQVGRSTDGAEFAAKAKPEACRPEKTSTVWFRDQCFEVDSETQGQSFGKRVAPELCTPPETAFRFDPKSRRCWVVDATTGGEGYRREARSNECRPPEADLKKIFVPTPGAQVGGDCLEVHKELGDARWAKKLYESECRPTTGTRYAWLSTGPFKGACWETAMTGPQDWSAISKVENCRPEKTVFSYQRTDTLNGVCFEVDQETQGQRWALKVDAAKCLSKE